MCKAQIKRFVGGRVGTEETVDVLKNLKNEKISRKTEIGVPNPAYSKLVRNNSEHNNRRRTSHENRSTYFLVICRVSYALYKRFLGSIVSAVEKQ